MSSLMYMMEQVRKLKNGVGLQSLLDAAYKILGNPIVLYSTDYTLLAYTEITTDDPIWNEVVTQGTFSKETRSFFGNEGFIEEMANAPRITFLKSDNLKYDRIVGKIFNKNNSYVSDLTIMACNKPFDENDPIVFEAVCKLVSREVGRSEVYQEYEQIQQETVIRKLIDGSYDMKLDMAHIGSIYDSLGSSLYIAVVDISQCDPQHPGIPYCRDLLKQTQPAYKYALYSNYVVIIVSTDDEVLAVTKALHKLIKVFEQNNMYAGISGRFENLFELQKYYAQALDAMQCALETRSSQRIFPCNESATDKMKRIKKLKNGEGIQYFLNKGPEIFGNPLLFHDMELNLLGYTENVEICDPIWEELITYGTSSDETINLFRTEGFINTMENTKGGAILISEKIKYDRISWRIYSNDNIMIGCLSIVNSMKPFTEDELVLFGAFSQKFSKEVGKIEFYSNYGQVYSRTVINRLLSGKMDDYTFYSEDIGNLYDNLMENLYLVVIDTAQCASGQVTLTYFRDLFTWPGTVNRYAIYADYIVIIMSIDNVPISEKNELAEISKVFERNNIYAGISNCFENIYESQKHYAEAVGALKSGINNKERNGGERIFQYTEACDGFVPTGS